MFPIRSELRESRFCRSRVFSRTQTPRTSRVWSNSICINIHEIFWGRLTALRFRMSGSGGRTGRSSEPQNVLVTTSSLFFRTTVHIRKPDPVSNISNLKRAFDIVFWGALVMAVAVLSTSLLLSVIWCHVSSRLEIHLCDIISESFLHVIGSFLYQGNGNGHKQLL